MASVFWPVACDQGLPAVDQARPFLDSLEAETPTLAIRRSAFVNATSASADYANGTLQNAYSS